MTAPSPARWSSVTWPTDTDPSLFDARVQRLVDDAVESFQATVGEVNGTRSEQILTWASLLRNLVGGMAVEAPEGSARTFVLRLGSAA